MHFRQQAHAVVDVVVHERHHRAVERRVVEHVQRTFEVVRDELDVGADTRTGPRELLSAPLDADHLGTPGDELGEVVARPASDVGEPQPIDLPAEIEHRRSVVVRVVEAILGLRVPPLGHLVVDRRHVADHGLLSLRLREPLHRRCELASCRGSRQIAVLGAELELHVRARGTRDLVRDPVRAGHLAQRTRGDERLLPEPPSAEPGSSKGSRT